MRDECLRMNFIHELQSMWYISYLTDYPMTIIIILMPSWIVKWTMMTMIDLSMKLEGCDHDLLHEAHPAQQKETPQMSIFFISVFKWFWVIECWWPSKEVFFNTFFPPFGTEKGWRSKNLSPGKIWPTCKKTKHGYGRPWRHPIGKVESSLLQKFLPIC